MKKRVIIAGASGRDFHNFLQYFKDNPEYKVIAFTQAQIPGIEKRSFPKELAGKRYKHNIPFYPEEKLPDLIKKYNVDYVNLAYSDLTKEELLNKISIVLSSGANFILIGPKDSMITSKKPLIAICATRTGAGKGTVTRRVLNILKEISMNKKVSVIRHPMPYLKLKDQVVQKFSSPQDLKKENCTFEEIEEYFPYIEKGYTVYAGVDYKKIIELAEKDCDIILFESGNNDISFFKPDLYITVADPLRPEGVFSYPGEANIKLADLIIINKSSIAKSEDIKKTIENIKSLNTKATVIKAKSVIKVDKPLTIKNKRVLLVEDSPSITHGGIKKGVSEVVAKKYKSKVLDPRICAVGAIKEILVKYPDLKTVPTLGYSKRQKLDFIKTLNKAKCDAIIFGSYVNISDITKINKPIVRITYELEENGKQLKEMIKKRIRKSIKN